MKIEIIFKIIMTLVSIIVIIVSVYSINWIWTHQIDVKETIFALFKKEAQKKVEWVATRDENAIVNVKHFSLPFRNYFLNIGEKGFGLLKLVQLLGKRTLLQVADQKLNTIL